MQQAHELTPALRAAGFPVSGCPSLPAAELRRFRCGSNSDPRELSLTWLWASQVQMRLRIAALSQGRTLDAEEAIAS